MRFNFKHVGSQFVYQLNFEPLRVNFWPLKVDFEEHFTFRLFHMITLTFPHFEASRNDFNCIRNTCNLLVISNFELCEPIFGMKESIFGE